MKTDKIVQKLVDSYGSWVQEEKENCHCAVMSKELYPYDAIFSPIRVNRITLKNRVVMAPMGNLNMCEENGRPSDKMLQYFFARAKGGTGLLTTGLIPISHGIDNTVTEPDCFFGMEGSGTGCPCVRKPHFHPAHPGTRKSGTASVCHQ